MDRLRNIKATEARALLRLANRLHAEHDPMNRKRQLLEGLCQLVGGQAGACIVRHDNRKTGEQTLVSTIEYRAADVPKGVLEPASTKASGSESLASPADEQMTLTSRMPLPNSTVWASLHLHRSPAQGVRFTPRQRMLVDLFHTEMTWVYQADVLLTSPSALSLSPRARQTLAHLLAGLSEKQIATRLHLSPNTVHHYVKSIHRHFSVSSRSELLARWVGK